MKPEQVLGLDVGERRIGVAFADTETRISVPLTTLDVDGQELDGLKNLVHERRIDTIVVGLPRNQQGEETAQSKLARGFAESLKSFDIPIVFQDESLTSVLAEKHLGSTGKPFSKADVDMHAAAVILEDYLEANHGH